jgi:hypothetical protein
MSDPVRDMLVEAFGPDAARLLLLSDDELAQVDADNQAALDEPDRDIEDDA